MIITRRAVSALARTAHHRLVPTLGRTAPRTAGPCSAPLLPLLQLITSCRATGTIHRCSSSIPSGSSSTRKDKVHATAQPLQHAERSTCQQPKHRLLAPLRSIFRRRRQSPSATTAAHIAGPGALSPHLGRPAAAAARIAHLGSSLIGALSSAAFTNFLGATTALALTRRGLRRLAGRRPARRAVPMHHAACSREVTVVTFNVRGIMDRWAERAPLLAECLKGLDADVVAFQEVLTGEFAQDQKLLGPAYSIHECRSALSHLAQAWGWAGYAFAATVRSMLAFSLTRSLLVGLPEWIEAWREQYQLSADWARLLRDLAMVPFFGNSIASRLPSVSGSHGSEVLMLGDFRAAQRVCLTVSATDDAADDAPAQPLLLWLVNTHLDHADAGSRARQAQELVAWMEGVKDSAAGIIITGDLNAPPYEDTHKHLEAAGYASASKAANGKEPERTWPSGLIAPLMDHGEAHCADYVYVWQAPGHDLSVLSAELRGDVPADGDVTLYPSDHVAIKVRLRVGRAAQ